MLETAANLTSGIPGIELPGIMGLLTQFMFAMLRIGSFMIAAPFFGFRAIPVTVRIVAAAMMTMPVISRLPMPEPEVIASLSAVPMILGELAIGISGGFVLTILFGATSLAGEKISSGAGLGFAAQYDPSAGGQAPILSNLFSLSLIGIFLALDGHLAALRMIFDSYESFPPGSPFNAARILGTGVAAGGEMFAIAARIMLPIVGILIIINIVVGVVTRSAPQLNIFSFGFPITMIVVYVLLYLHAPVTGWAFENLVTTSLETLAAMLGGLSDG